MFVSNVFILMGAMLASTKIVVAINDDGTSEDEKTRILPRELTVTSWNDMPFSGIIKKNGKWTGDGYAFYLFNLISSKLNFTYTIKPPKEHILGNETTGILSLLHKKEVDIAVAFLPVLPQMRRYCLFSTALDETRLTALMKRPQESATGSGLLAPFDKTVWILVFASLIFVGPIIYLFAYIRGKLGGNPDYENYSLSSCFWFVYSSLVKQGTNIVPHTDSTRMLFATWWIFILILTSFYTANLTAFLTKPQFTLSISSLEDIVQKGYNWATYKGGIIDFLLSEPTPNDLSLLNTSYNQGKGVIKYNHSSGTILEIVNAKRLYLAEAHYLQAIIFEDFVNKTQNRLDYSLRCTYVIMPGSILVADRAFGFPHGSKIANTLNEMLLRLVETGIIQQKKNEKLPLAEICPVDLRSTDRQLRNTDLLLTYKVVGGGYGLATLIFVIELSCACAVNLFRSKRRGNNKNCDRKPKNNGMTSELMGNITRNNVLLKPGLKFSSQTIPKRSEELRQYYINGRCYRLVVDNAGIQRLVPVRTPSAFLFHY